MRNWKIIGRWLRLRALPLRLVIRSHPLRVRIALSFVICLTLLAVLRHYLWIHIPIWVNAISHPLFLLAQAHPIFGRILHVAFNAIPDLAFALLALAGLAYLVPKSWIDRLEDLIWVRIFLIVLFGTFGFSAIIINAVKSENQEFKDGENDKRMGIVLGSVLNIQDALKPKAANLTESDRKKHLLESLRAEYIATHSSIDPEILAGNKMPPDDWLNNRLGSLNENWQVHTPPSQQSAVPARPQIVQEIYPEEHKDTIQFAFYQADMATGAQTVKLDPLSDSRATFTVSGIIKGNAPAKNLDIWVRICNKYCSWVSVPPGFVMVDADHPYDREIVIADFPANVNFPKWDFTVGFPAFRKFDAVDIAIYYTCDNCPTVDWSKPQHLRLAQTFNAATRLPIPSTSYIPKPAH